MRFFFASEMAQQPLLADPLQGRPAAIGHFLKVSWCSENGRHYEDPGSEQKESHKL